MAGSRRVGYEGQTTEYHDDDLDDSLINSPARRLPIRPTPSHGRQTSRQQHSRSDDASNDENDMRLKAELASVRKVNEAIEGVLHSLERAKSNMKTVNQTVSNASALLNIWTRILSQTEHNQRLILDPTWQGASQDLADIEEETITKQQAVERKEAEEQERRAALARKAEEDQKRKAEASSIVPKTRPGTRGRGMLPRGSGTSRSTYGTTGRAPSSRTGSAAGNSTTARQTESKYGQASSRGTRGRGI